MTPCEGHNPQAGNNWSSYKRKQVFQPIMKHMIGLKTSSAIQSCYNYVLSTDCLQFMSTYRPYHMISGQTVVHFMWSQPKDSWNCHRGHILA